jgi:hypothetical protein
VTPVDGEGIYCVVQAHEVEPKTREGWLLVGVLDSELAVSMAESEAPQWTMNSATLNTGYVAPVPTMKTYVVKTPTFLLRRGTESELARMVAELENQRVTQAERQTAMENLQKDYLTLKSAKEKADKEIAEAHAKNTVLQKLREALEEALTIAKADVQRLEERLGKSAQPTSFERLLSQDDEVPAEKSDPPV